MKSALYVWICMLGIKAGQTLSSQEVLGAIENGHRSLGGTRLGKLKQIPCSLLFLESTNRAFTEVGAKPLNFTVPAPDS